MILSFVQGKLVVVLEKEMNPKLIVCTYDCNGHSDKKNFVPFIYCHKIIDQSLTISSSQVRLKKQSNSTNMYNTYKVCTSESSSIFS